MEIVKVIVRKATLPTYWYANKIGQVFECYQRGSNQYQVVDTLYGQVRFIVLDDCIPVDYIGRKPIKRFKFL